MRHRLYIVSKRGETVKPNYNGQLSGLKEGPCDVVWPEDGFPILVVETPTITEGDDMGFSKRVLSFVLEFADVLLRVAGHRVR